MTTDKPAHIQLRSGELKITDFSTPLEDTIFETPHQRDAARYILVHWEETHNMNEIARRSGYSPSHIRNVYHEFFEPADVPPELDRDDETDEEGEYTEGYRDGYRDGFKDGLSEE